MINDISVLGLMLGCLLAKNFLILGRKQTVLVANVMASMSVALCIYLNLWTIFVGKFIFGFTCGLNIVACSIYNKETLPAKTLSYMGTGVNTGIVFGLVVSTFTQNMSLDSLSKEEQLTTDAWRWPLVFVPMMMSSASTMLWLLILPYDSIEFCLDNGHDSCAKVLLKKMYKFDDPENVDDDLNNLVQ